MKPPVIDLSDVGFAQTGALDVPPEMVQALVSIVFSHTRSVEGNVEFQLIRRIRQWKGDLRNDLLRVAQASPGASTAELRVQRLATKQFGLTRAEIAQCVGAELADVEHALGGTPIPPEVPKAQRAPAPRRKRKRKRARAKRKAVHIEAARAVE